MIAAAPTESIPEGLTLESVRITELRGPMTRQIRVEMLRDKGEAAWRDLLGQLSEECRCTFATPIGLYEWIPAAHSMELSLAFMAMVDPDFTYRRGLASAEEQLTVVNRWMLRLMSPGFLLQNMPRLFSFYYRGGRVVVDHLGSGFAEVSLWADAFYPAWYELGLKGWLQGALALTGAKGVAIQYRAPEGEGLHAFRHRYTLSWE